MSAEIKKSEVATNSDSQMPMQSTALPGVRELYEWDEAISPVAAFRPDRADLCTSFQLSVADEQTTRALAHVESATKHLRAAYDALEKGSEDESRLLREIHQSNTELARIAYVFGVLLRN